jgi:hypothetical protein
MSNKKINKLALEDAHRYYDALKVRDEVYARVDASPLYQKAITEELDKLAAVVPTAPAKPFRTGTGPSLKTIAVLVVGVIVLHETGYDEILWNKVKSYGRKARAKAEELKEEHPDIVQAAQDVKETATTAANDIKETVKDAVDQETSRSNG